MLLISLSSVGRALEWHSRGRRFDPVRLHNAFEQFPIIIFGHGFLMSFSAYQNLWEEFVTRGYIIVFPRTEEGLINNHQEFGWDLQFLVTRMQEEGIDNDSPIFGAVG